MAFVLVPLRTTQACSSLLPATPTDVLSGTSRRAQYGIFSQPQPISVTPRSFKHSASIGKETTPGLAAVHYPFAQAISLKVALPQARTRAGRTPLRLPLVETHVREVLPFHL